MATIVSHHALKRMKQRSDIKRAGDLIHLFETGQPVSKKRCRRINIAQYKKPNILIRKNGQHIILAEKQSKDIIIITYFPKNQPNYYPKGNRRRR